MATWGSSTNVVLTPSIIAKEALMALENNMVLAGLVYRAYSKEFRKVGDTITVRKPATFTAELFDRSSGVTLQNISEGSVAVKLDKLIDVSFELTSEQRTLDILAYSEQVIQPSMRAHAQYLDLLLAGLYVNIPYSVASDGSDEAGKLADMAELEQMLNTNKVPTDSRYAVLSPAAKAKYIVVPSFLNAEKRGDTDGLKNASLGRIFGMDFYMDQNIVTHAKGTIDTSDTATAVVSGDVLTIVGVGATCTIKKGDIITITNSDTSTSTYVLLEDATIATTPGTVVAHYPPVAKAASGGAIAVVDTVGANNIVFHRNAFALVSAPLAPPMGGALASTETYKGVSCRVVMGYDINKKVDTVSIDMLIGVKTLTEELACRLIE